MVVIILSVVVLLYAAAAMILFFAQDAIIFPRHATGPTTDRPPHSPVDVVWLEAPGGERVEAWFVPGAGRTPSNPGPAVILAHGNATLIDHTLPTANVYAARGISVLSVEYRGYGLSDGAPSQRAIVADFVRAYDMLQNRPEVRGQPIIGHGRSLGGGVIAQLADRRDLSALIIESTFTSVVAMAHRSLMPGFICRHPFRTDRILADYEGKILLMHGTGDTVIPISHGRRLAKIGRDVHFVELDCGHNDLWINDEFVPTLDAFLGQLELDAESAAD